MITLRVLGSISLQGATSGDAETVLRQPKRMALLAYLGCLPRGTFARRDHLLALLWPELDDTRARHGLRQSLHVLRNTLGPDAVLRRGDAELALDASVISSDAADLLAALDDGRAADAVSLYRGDLLPGFHVSEAPEFERWLDDTRAGLRRRVAEAANGLSVACEQAGDLVAAVNWARRRHALAPDDEAAFRRLLTLLDRVGDRVGALQAYAEFARRLRQDLDVDPTPETQQLVHALRRNRAASAPGPASARGVPVASAAGTLASAPADGPSVPGRRRGGARWMLAGLAIAATMVVTRVTGVRTLDSRPATGIAAAASSRAMPSAAQLMYDQAMRAWGLGDRTAAERLMRVAYEGDSSFGLAALQLGHLLGLRGEHDAAQRLQQRAVELAPKQSDHDRLLILALHASHFNEPTQLAVAETLAIRYPSDLEGQLLVGKARWMSGHFGSAIGPLERVIATSRTGRDSTGVRCLSCEAYSLLAATYEAMDSLPAAERTARAWLRARPSDLTAWNVLSYQLAIAGRYPEALSARHRADDLEPNGADGNALGEILLRAGDFRTLEDILDVRERTGSTEDAYDARFLRWRLLREQGRWREALALTESMDRNTRAHPMSHGLAVALHAQSLFEAGHGAAAAAVWDSLARVRAGSAEPAASAAIGRMSRLLRVSDALALTGDTARLVRLADSVQHLGLQSSWVRDHRMHYFVRGLLFAARGDHAASCDAFLGSLTGASTTFARANLAAGSQCLQAGRLQPALAAVRGVLRGPIGAGGTSGTLTQAHQLAAQLFDVLLLPDSARSHRDRVAEALRREGRTDREHSRAPDPLSVTLGARARVP